MILNVFNQENKNVFKIEIELFEKIFNCKNVRSPFGMSLITIVICINGAIYLVSIVHYPLPTNCFNLQLLSAIHMNLQIFLPNFFLFPSLSQLLLWLRIGWIAFFFLISKWIFLFLRAFNHTQIQGQFGIMLHAILSASSCMTETFVVSAAAAFADFFLCYFNNLILNEQRCKFIDECI